MRRAAAARTVMENVVVVELHCIKVPGSPTRIARQGLEREQHVMQSRSIRRSGQPTCAIASSNASF